MLTILALATIIGFFSFYPPQATKGEVQAIEIVKPTVQGTIQNATKNTRSQIIALATKVAIKNGLNVNHFIGTISCEIKKTQGGLWDYKAQSILYRKGVRENSWGGWQINLTAHPEVSKKNAQDIVWATNWSAKQWLAGKAYQWTCWRLKYGG